MNKETFDFSKHPNFLEWYQCYNDLASKDWLDGMEMRLHRSTWDERAIAKWNFFYRPFKPAIGRPQKHMIGQRTAAIEVSQAEIGHAQKAITEEQERIRRAVTILAIEGVGLTIMSLWFLSNAESLIVLSIVAAFFAISNFEKKRKAAGDIIRNLNASIAQERAAIQTAKKEIDLLEKEILLLVSQIYHPVNTETIEEWLGEEISHMELACLSEFVGKTVIQDNVRDHLSQDFGDPRVYGLLIDSWGFLQPTASKGPLGTESTGLSRAKEELKQFIATWQVGSKDPIFRLLFIQYIFPLKRNLNICSFFYDFVTRRTYGKRLETFQYNHVTNYSIREVEIEDEPWVKEAGLTTMASLFGGKTLRALTIAVSSGNHFRCVLVDDDVVNLLNAILKQEEKYRALETSSVNDDDLLKTFKGDRNLLAVWKAEQKAKIDAEMKDVVREKQQIQWTSSRTPRVLTHVRNCVEEYIHRFQETVSLDETTRK